MLCLLLVFLPDMAYAAGGAGLSPRLFGGAVHNRTICLTLCHGALFSHILAWVNSYLAFAFAPPCTVPPDSPVFTQGRPYYMA